MLVVLALAAAAHAKTLVIGHRGNSRFEPENTMAAFRSAIEMGADGIEVDLRLTADEQIVMIHDATVDRTTDGSGSVNSMTVAELKELDAGNGERIPTFVETLELVKGTGLVIIMDQKDNELGKYIREALDVVGGMDDQVVASCWSDVQVADMVEYLPRSAKQRLGSAPFLRESNEYFMDAIGKQISSFSLSYATVSDDFLLDAQRHLMPVAGWTVNNEGDMRDMVTRGFSAILTDDVPLAISVVNNNGTAARPPLSVSSSRALADGSKTITVRSNESTSMHNVLILVAVVAVNVFFVAAAYKAGRRSAGVATRTAAVESV